MIGQPTLNDIPWGCTHVQLANPLAYCQRPTFMRWAKWYYSEDKPGDVNCWYIWHVTANFSLEARRTVADELAANICNAGKEIEKASKPAPKKQSSKSA